jgi:hypothetical protein
VDHDADFDSGVAPKLPLSPDVEEAIANVVGSAALNWTPRAVSVRASASFSVSTGTPSADLARLLLERMEVTQKRLADTLIGWKELEKLSRIVNHAELKKNDYNISPSRYIHTSDAETYRPIGEIVEELNVIEGEARETDKALKEILEKIGV